MLHILAILSVIFGVIEYLVADDKADQIKGLLYHLSSNYYVN